MIKKATLINVIGLWEGVLILALRLNLNPTTEYVHWNSVLLCLKSKTISGTQINVNCLTFPSIDTFCEKFQNNVRHQWLCRDIWSVMEKEQIMAVDAMMREIMNIGWTSSQIIRHLSQSGTITLEERKELLVRILLLSYLLYKLLLTFWTLFLL